MTLELLPKQEKFTFHVQYNPKAKFVWYVWWFWSWKTFIGSYNSILLAIRYPKNRWLIARKTLVDCKNTTQKTFFEVLEGEFNMHEWEHYRFDRHEQRLYFFDEEGKDSSEIIFSWLDEIAKLKSLELWFFWIDEVDEVDQEIFTLLAKWRLRLKWIPRRVWFITSNSEGKNWTYKIFVKWVWLPEDARSRYFMLRASSLENKFLPEEYIRELLTLEGTLYVRYVEWWFNAFEWQIYDDFDQAIHVIKPFEIPPDRQTVYWLDHGNFNPTAILEAHCNYDWEIFITWERYQGNTRIEEHAAALKERMKKIGKWDPHPEAVCDPSLFYKTQVPTAEKPFPWAVADTYQEAWISFIRANNDVSAGIDHVKNYFAKRKIYIFETCTNTIDEIEWYSRAKKADWQSAEEPKKKNDHACDALRYLLMTKFPPPQRLEYKKTETIEELVARDIRETKQWINNIESETNFE